MSEQAWRDAYAEDLRVASGVRNADLIRAFARVSREAFLGPPPWLVIDPAASQSEWTDDPERLYARVLVAIDAERGLNNGEPGSLALWLDSLDLAAGERVVHVGCGLGYYTAIIAEVVGPTGAVIAIEVDAGLAARAKQNLKGYGRVEVHCASGIDFDFDSCDALFANAGLTQLPLTWLSALRPGGRLLLPLTVDVLDHGVGGGHYLRVERTPKGFAARFVSPVGIYPCSGGRSEEANDELKRAMQAGGHDGVRSVRTDSHERDASCWLHRAETCLSTEDPPGT